RNDPITAPKIKNTKAKNTFKRSNKSNTFSIVQFVFYYKIYTIFHFFKTIAPTEDFPSFVEESVLLNFCRSFVEILFVYQVLVLF
ncbi:hypothetical protein, partial [Caldisericum sp.]|uniref:hypothetical protein n=1 Tax=Caldisericum sp. TaxID=2499687 RepID=UPI003D145B00